MTRPDQTYLAWWIASDCGPKVLRQCLKEAGVQGTPTILYPYKV